MIRVFHDQKHGGYVMLNLIGPKSRLQEIMEWLREHRSLIPIDEHILKLPARILK